MIIRLNKRSKQILTFAAEMKAVSYLHLAQYLAPNYEPATVSPPISLDEQAMSKEKPTRGGNKRNAPWPRDRRLRLKAVSRIINELQLAGYVTIEEPWSDSPKWFWVTMAGIHRLGMDYNDAHFLADEDELEHTYQIVRIRLLIGRKPEEKDAAWFKHTWISERAIKAKYPQNTLGAALAHLPDGALELDEDADVKMADGKKIAMKRGDLLAVEIERSRKDFARLDRILPNLLENYEGVWYFCRPKAADAVHATIDRLVQAKTLTPDQAELIRVIDLPEEE